MNTKNPRRPARRALVALVSVSLVLGPLAESAYAGPTPLADVPIAAKVAAKPNIVYTLDDSGSMQYHYLPDWVISTVAPLYCRGGNATAACKCGAGNQGFASCTAAASVNYTGGNNQYDSPPFYAADFNRMAYDPNVTYTPPVKADGTPLTHTIGVDTDVNGNQINLAKVQTDPFISPATQANLSGKVNVPLYCNTDWPLTADPMKLVLNPDVGDANGEYLAGSGAWCRINGTEYDASAASGAPAVKYANGNVLYDYPYLSSSGALGTQYFYRQNLTTKALYCDKSSPYWPRGAAGGIASCNGGTPTCGGLPCAPKQQTCNLSTPAKTCNPVVASRNYTPAACKAGPAALYCAPNTGGSDGNSPGTGSTPECQACTCNADYQPPNVKKCSIVGNACTSVCGVLGCDTAECPDQPAAAPNGCSGGFITYGPLPSLTCSAQLWDPVNNVTMATTVLQDSDPSVPGGVGKGMVCRHNNQVYAVSGAPVAGGPFIYPRSNVGDVYAANKAGPAPFTQKGDFGAGANGYTMPQGAAGCPTVGTTVSIPRHYYTIDSVQFCNGVDATVDGPWKGFGTGVCKPANDLTTFKNVKYGQFHRIPLRAGWNGGNYNYVDQLTGLPATRTYAQEIVNYANWYAYYRLRAHAAKTTSSLSFNLLDNSYRVGFHTLGTEPPPNGTGVVPTWVDVKDFNLAQKTAWWTGLFGVPTVTNYKTPTLSAMLRIGNLFETGGAGGLPATVNPLPAGAKDPIDVNPINGQLISCQNNYHILFTDGFTNQINLPAVAGDQDQNIPGTLPADVVGDPDKVLPDLRVATWPKPFLQGAPAVGDTLADVATYYWARDLRPGLKNDVPASSGKTPNDVDPSLDVAWWQHVNFSAISFGSAGTLDATNQGAFNKPGTTLGDLTTGLLNWPNLTTPNNPPLPASNKGAVAVDDLWHATAMGRGSFVYATSPLEVEYGLNGILAGISNQRKSRAGAAFSGLVLSAANDIIYEATIEPGWAGDLLKVQIDPDPASPTAGQEVATLWRASDVLANQIKPASAADTPWLDETKRRIVTWNGGTKVAFRAVPSGSMASVLSDAQLQTLSPDPVPPGPLPTETQKKMVAYLRGGSTYDTGLANPTPPPPDIMLTIEGTQIGQFRKRFGALGDISNAQPLVVSAPIQNIFYEGNDPGFTAFQAANKARPDRIVVAANDGMVHVIDQADGHEVFGYVPSSLLRTAVDASGRPTGIQALTFPLFYKHHFYVDSSPRTANIDFNSAGVKGGASDWHTIVVGGMGKGGDSYYAIDLTNGDAATEADAAAKLLWEYHDPDWTYTYGHPVIAKTYAFGWTVIVTSGYNNVSGEGRIYFLDPVTGKPFAKMPFMSTGPVSCTGPDGNPQTSGLAQINGFTKDFHNQFVEQVYGGDLCGNLWRFDVQDPNPANWTVNLFATLSDGAAPQPVTTAPQIEIDFANGVDRYVFIGTGRLLDPSDLTTPSPAQQQTLYAIRDGSLTKPLPPPPAPGSILPIDARAMLTPVAAAGAALPGVTANGWYHDLPTGANAERIVIDVEADVNAVVYIGTQIVSDPCTIALPANVYAREFSTASSLIDEGGGVWYHHDVAGGVGFQIVGLYNPATGETTLGGLLSHEIPGTKPVSIKNPGFGARNRFSWRMLTGQ